MPLRLVIIAAAAILGFGGTILAYWLLPQAQVAIMVNPKTIDQEITFKVSSAPTDTSVKHLNGNLIEIEVEDSLDMDTSGQSEIGDKAKGEVTIYNKTSSTKKFTAGTILVGPSSLQFDLDSEVTIASQSATDSGITFGKATAKVTAVKVGTDANLSAETPLGVKGFDTTSFSAKTNGALSGGTSKTVKSVAKADQDKLLEELTVKLTDKAKSELASKASPGQTIIDTGLQTDIVSKKFTKAVAEEADKVGLTMRLRATTFAFATTEITSLVAAANVPDGFTLKPESTQVKITAAEFIDDQVAVTATITSILIPNLNLDDITAYLKGKSPSAAEAYFRSLPNFSRVQINITPSLPKFLKTFPRLQNHIHVSLEVVK